METQNNDEDVESLIKKTFTSSRFLSALSTSLPKGDRDEEYGLDFVPYMLQSIATRKEHFDKKASQFFIITITLGVLFIITTIAFGYILVDDSSTGTAKTISNINKSLLYLKENISSISEIKNEANLNKAVKNAEDTAQKISDAEYAALKNATQNVIDKNDILALATITNQLLQKIDIKQNHAGEYKLALEELRDVIDKELKDDERLKSALINEVKELRTLTLKADDQLQKSENKIPELLKRLSVGLIVITFFIVILRYTSSLYKANFDQVIIATRDDDRIRKFYVSYKSAGDDPELKKLAVTGLVSSADGGKQQASGSEGGLNKAEAEIVKEILAALTKKL